MIGYFYLHSESRDLIYKPAIVVDSDPQYFDSPFVLKHWPSDSKNRADAWTIALESLALGANALRVKELATKWGLTFDDFLEFMARTPKPSDLLKDGIELFAPLCFDRETNDEFWDDVELKLKQKHGKD